MRGRWISRPSAVRCRGHAITYVIFHPGMQNLNLVVRKYQTIPNEEYSIKIKGTVVFKLVSIMEDKAVEIFQVKEN